MSTNNNYYNIPPPVHYLHNMKFSHVGYNALSIIKGTLYISSESTRVQLPYNYMWQSRVENEHYSIRKLLSKTRLKYV